MALAGNVDPLRDKLHFNSWSIKRLNQTNEIFSELSLKAINCTLSSELVTVILDGKHSHLFFFSTHENFVFCGCSEIVHSKFLDVLEQCEVYLQPIHFLIFHVESLDSNKQDNRKIMMELQFS